MNDRIIELEEYRIAITNKKNLDNRSITIDELSLEEIEDLKKQYQKEIIDIDNDIQKLVDEKKKYKRILEK